MESSFNNNTYIFIRSYLSNKILAELKLDGRSFKIYGRVMSFIFSKGNMCPEQPDEMDA